MIRRFSVLIFLVCVGLIFSILGLGCEKKESKEQVKETIPVTEPEKMLGIDLKAQIIADSMPKSAKAGTIIILPVKVKNLSNFTWPAKSSNPVHLSYHWLDKDGKKAVVWDGVRTILPKDLAPGEELLLNPKIEVPKTIGNYILELDLVQEKIAWFGKKGSATVKTTIIVK